MQVARLYRVRGLALALALAAPLACQSGDPSYLPLSPCRVDNGGCDANATCSATRFATEATCTCREGFVGDGHTCAACEPGYTARANQCVDDCLTANGGCDAHATCGHDEGGVTCSCAGGWVGDGRSCADGQLCEKTSGLCGVGTCVNGVGTYSCSCPVGYLAADGTCVDRCTISNGSCSAAQVCSHAEDTSIVCLPKYSVISTGLTGVERDATDSTALLAETCGVRTDGTLWCWGRNDLHQIDETTVVNVSSPRQKGTDSNWLTVSVGAVNICGMKTDHTVWCTTDGRGTLWQVGTDNDWTTVEVGVQRACGIRAGQIWCWSLGTTAQTGGPLQGTVTREVADFDWATLSAGDRTSAHLCALKADQSLWCWGENSSGQVGDGGTTNRTTPQRISSRRWLDVSAGHVHTCAIDDRHRLWCWGYASDYALGIATLAGTKVTVPTRVGADEDWVAVSAGRDHTCAVKLDGTLWCWGREWKGQLGDGGFPAQPIGDDSGATHDLPASPTPRQVGTDANWASLSAGSGTTCALRSNGSAWCWGNNASGQLGNGRSGSDRPSTPVAVASGVTFASLSLRGQTVCGLDTSGKVWCWGDNTAGQFGNGTQVSQSVPTAVATPTPWASLSVSRLSACAVGANHSLWCWGRTGLTTRTGYGNTATGSMTPQQFGADGQWTSVTTGDSFFCASSVAGALSCWLPSQAKAVDPFVDGLTPRDMEAGLVSIAGEADTACGLKDNGELYCWGDNGQGLLGLGHRNSQGLQLVRIDGEHTWSSFTVGLEAACAIRADDQSLWCWGSQEHGALGNGKTENSVAALSKVGEGGEWSSVSCQGADCCATDTDGAVWCWGALTGKNLPRREGSATDWASVRRGDNFQCALKQNGKAYCWGEGGEGQLGNAGPFASAPMAVLP